MVSRLLPLHLPKLAISTSRSPQSRRVAPASGSQTCAPAITFTSMYSI